MTEPEPDSLPAALLKGVEKHPDGWHTYVENHHPCVAGFALDHSGCTITQRFVGPLCESREAAIEQLEHMTIMLEGADGPVGDWEGFGS